MITPIHHQMKRRLVSSGGELGAYLNSDHSALKAGTTWQDEQSAGSGTEGLTIVGNFSSPQIGSYVENVTQDFVAQIIDTPSGELTVHYPLQTTGTNWGEADGTDAGKLIDSSASFTSDVEVGMIVALRDLSDHAIVNGIDSDSQLDLSKDLFASGDKYTIMKGFRSGDTIRLGTAVLNGTDGHVMVEIPRFYYGHQFDDPNHKWMISPYQQNGLEIFPAFQKPGGGLHDAIYIGAFEGVIDDMGFGEGTVLTDYNLGSDELGSFAGMRPVTNGQRSEFRQAAGNNGPGWQIIDWYMNFAWQLLFLTEYGSMHSQDVLGDGLTEWSGGDRDNWVDATANRAVNHSGYSIPDGNKSVNRNTGGGNASGVLSYRGIENPWGNIWKWLDGVNYNDHRVYLANDPANYEDDIDSDPYFDTGLDQPDSNGYQSKIHNTKHGLIPAESSGGSSSHIPDYYYQNSGWRVARAGGGVADGAQAGFAALRATTSSSYRNTDTGSRVCFRK